MNAVAWKPLVGLISHFDMALIPLAVWRLTLYPVQDIVCECGSLKTACRIDFTFWYGLNTTKTSDAIDVQDIACECGSLKTDWLRILIWQTLLIWGILRKIKMAAIAVWRLTLYPMQDIACECGSLKSACQIDFTFWYGLFTSYTSNIIDLGHSTKIKINIVPCAGYFLWKR